MGPGMVAKLGRIKLVTRKKVRPSSVFRIEKIRIPKSVLCFDLRRRIGSVESEGKFAIRALYSSLQVLRHICLAVKKRDVTRVQVAFIRLEVVALVKNFSDQP